MTALRSHRRGSETFRRKRLGPSGFSPSPGDGQTPSNLADYKSFHLTKLEWKKASDPGLSLEERYGNPETYLAQLKAVCQKYEEAELFLEEDILRTMEIQEKRGAELFQTDKPQ